MKRQQTTPTLFPYTTLFRSRTFRSTAGRRQSDEESDPPRRRGLRTGPGRPDLQRPAAGALPGGDPARDRKSTRLNSSHVEISYAVFCLKKKIYLEELLFHFN